MLLTVNDLSKAYGENQVLSSIDQIFAGLHHDIIPRRDPTMYHVRLFDPIKEGYAAIVQVYNLDWPDDPETAEVWLHNDTHRNMNFLAQRFIVETDGMVVAEGMIEEVEWSHIPGKYGYYYSVRPDYATVTRNGQSVHEAILPFVMSFLAPRDPAPIKLTTGIRENRPERMAFLAAHGFELKMREPLSELQVARFDFSRFAGARDRLAAQGYAVLSLPELQQRDADWHAKLYELEWTVSQDVPSPDPATKQPIEEWDKLFIHPNFRTDAWFIAVRDDELVGLSTLWIAESNPKKFYTGLTGVVRAHRRNGLALAMKLRAIEFAQRRGAERIETGNEENNPMLGINIMLGFEPTPAWLEYEKQLT